MSDYTRTDKINKYKRLIKRVNPDIIIYTDGSIRMKSKDGGGGLLVLDRRNRKKKRVLLSLQLYYKGDMTSAKSELATFVVGLMVAANAYYSGITVLLLSDNEYCVKGYNEWLKGWLEKGILHTKSNPEYWEMISMLKGNFVPNATFKVAHCHGHTDSKKEDCKGIMGNYLVDVLAARGVDEKKSKVRTDVGGSFKEGLADKVEEILTEIGIDFAW
jgi:ribonuclease HI